MIGFFIALLSGAMMSIQGVFNTQVTKTTGVWVSIPIADGFAGILAAVVLMLQIKSFRRGEYKAL